MALSVTHALVADGTPKVTTTDWNAGHVNTGTLDVANGGTGLASYAIGDLPYASGTTALSKRAAVATGSVLASAGVGVAPVWTTTPLLQLDAVSSVYFDPIVGSGHSGIRLNKLSSDTTHTNYLGFAIDGDVKFGMGMDTANADFVPVYHRAMSRDILRVNPQSRFILGPGIGSPMDDASLEIAGNATSARAFVVRGTLTGGGTDAAAVLVETMMTPAANQSAYGVMLQPQFTEAGSGTHTRFVSIEVRAPSITPGAAALTDAVSGMFFEPTGGINNWPLWVVGGTVRIDGHVRSQSGAEFSIGSLDNQNFCLVQNNIRRMVVDGTGLIPVTTNAQALGSAGLRWSDGYFAGTLSFGTRTALGAETVTGYITITDAGGTSRKLAVVS